MAGRGSRSARPAAASRGRLSALTARRRSILIVEDDFSTRRLLEIVLQGKGYDVHAVGDAETGLQILGSTPIDLILLDLMLPRASGVVLLRARRHLPSQQQAPVIVISAVPELDAMRTELRYLGSSLALKKPFNMEDLLSAVETHARKRRPRAATRRGEIAVQQAQA